MQTWADYEILTIDEVTEDLILWLPGHASAYVKAYWDLTPDPNVTLPDVPESFAAGPASGPVTIETQEKAQKALVQIDNAIVAKDKIRANLGAMQNMLENTVANISMQAENLQAAESRISDVDVAQEMTEFVRNQVLTQAATAMLGQANSYPHMLINLIQS